MTKIKFDKHNYRKHSDENKRVIRKSLEECGAGRRSAGQARNMMQEYAIKNGIAFYMVQDDDTQSYGTRFGNMKEKVSKPECVRNSFYLIREFMQRQRIGLFGISQTGDLIGGCIGDRVFRKKVMNTTFYLMPYIIRGERGVQDDDTSLYAGVMNAGLFTGSTRYGLILHQMPSAKQKGGLTDLYNECKLLNKALVCPIQYPSAIRAEKQKANGARLHHRINYRYLFPCILRRDGERSNIAWDTYEEDIPFTNEPKRKYIIE